MKVSTPILTENDINIINAGLDSLLQNHAQRLQLAPAVALLTTNIQNSTRDVANGESPTNVRNPALVEGNDQ